jgi:hypothetical protein
MSTRPTPSQTGRPSTAIETENTTNETIMSKHLVVIMAAAQKLATPVFLNAEVNMLQWLDFESRD